MTVAHITVERARRRLRYARGYHALTRANLETTDSGIAHLGDKLTNEWLLAMREEMDAEYRVRVAEDRLESVESQQREPQHIGSGWRNGVTS